MTKIHFADVGFQYGEKTVTLEWMLYSTDAVICGIGTLWILHSENTVLSKC